MSIFIYDIMLQFITKDTERYSAAELAQMAIEGGCGWVELARAGSNSAESSSDSFRDTAMAVQEVCREADVIMTIEGDVELVNELKVTGVHLGKSDMSAAEAREALGPHAIIGVDVDSAEEAILLQPADIDYVVFGSYPETTVDEYAGFVASLTDKGCQLPVVAHRDSAQCDVAPLLNAGVKGIIVGDAVREASDPVDAVVRLLGQIDSAE